jgi:phage shock protein C
MTDDAGTPPPEVPTPPPSSVPPPPITHQLRRSRDDRMIAGVCGGLAYYLGVDPVIVRVAAVVLALTGGAAVIAYIVAWVLIPEARPGELPAGARPPGNPETLRFVAGAVLIAIGGLALLGVLIPAFVASRVVWPLLLVGVGVFLLLRGTNR